MHKIQTDIIILAILIQSYLLHNIVLIIEHSYSCLNVIACYRTLKLGLHIALNNGLYKNDLNRSQLVTFIQLAMPRVNK